MKVVIDTNVLLSVFLRKLDVFGKTEKILGEPCSFFLMQSNVGELSSFAVGASKQARAARGALSLVGNRLILLPSTGKADDALLGLKPVEFAVATNDKKLVAKLKRKGFRVLTESGGRMRVV